MSDPVPEDLVRRDLASGRSTEEIAGHLISVGVRPIPAIKALKSGAGIPLDEAKTYVDRSLGPEQQEANERLRDTAESIAFLTEAMRNAPCMAAGCSAQIESFVLYMADPGQGFHAVAPLVLEGACKQHREVVWNEARASSFGWLEPGIVSLDQAPDLLDWFYGSSGLSAGPRGISIVMAPRRL